MKEKLMNDKSTSKYSRPERVYFALILLAIFLVSTALTLAFDTDFRPHKPAQVEAKWADNIRNPANHDFVVETAFNCDLPLNKVTQEMFNIRYLKGYTPAQLADMDLRTGKPKNR